MTILGGQFLKFNWWSNFVMKETINFKNGGILFEKCKLDPYRKSNG
ncbi:MAG: hypothetical protein CM15mV12_3220 [uncultured marine virus]|nr:MAG: hypothetical protein CM15mV12_3220 [uncultured marine virus]